MAISSVMATLEESTRSPSAAYLDCGALQDALNAGSTVTSLGAGQSEWDSAMKSLGYATANCHDFSSGSNRGDVFVGGSSQWEIGDAKRLAKFALYKSKN